MKLEFNINVNITSCGLRDGINPHKVYVETNDLGDSAIKISTNHVGFTSYKECIDGVFSDIKQHIERLEELYAIKRE